MHFLALFFALIWGALALIAVVPSSAQAVLRVVFSSNLYGEVVPCGS